MTKKNKKLNHITITHSYSDKVFLDNKVKLKFINIFEFLQSLLSKFL